MDPGKERPKSIPVKSTHGSIYNFFPSDSLQEFGMKLFLVKGSFFNCEIEMFLICRWSAYEIKISNATIGV